MWSPHILFLSLIFGGIIQWKTQTNKQTHTQKTPYLPYFSVTRYANTTIFFGLIQVQVQVQFFVTHAGTNISLAVLHLHKAHYKHIYTSQYLNI